MSEKTDMLNSIMLTFAIGFVAGIAPFLFMDLLPNLLNQNTSSHRPNYQAISITGVLIGLITSIMFAKNFKEKEPRDIFFYALGLPAILIATVTNMNTNFSAKTVVDDTRASASMSILRSDIEPVIQEFTPLVVPVTDGKSNKTGLLDLLIFTKTAHAEERSKQPKEQAVKSFVVTVGEYTDKDTAVAAYKALLNNKLNSEKYISKNPKLLQINGNSYAIIYSDFSDRNEAVKAYKLLKINDPEYNVQILRGAN